MTNPNITGLTSGEGENDVTVYQDNDGTLMVTNNTGTMNVTLDQYQQDTGTGSYAPSSNSSGSGGSSSKQVQTGSTRKRKRKVVKDNQTNLPDFEQDDLPEEFDYPVTASGNYTGGYLTDGLDGGFELSQSQAAEFVQLNRAAQGNPIAQEAALIIATQGIPPGMTVEQFVATLPSADPTWSVENYEAVLAVFYSAHSKRNPIRTTNLSSQPRERHPRENSHSYEKHTHEGREQGGTPTPTLTPAPTQTPEYNDPCANSNNPRQCYLRELEGFGIDIMDSEDIEQNEEFARNTVLDGEFSNEQLSIILEAVQRTGQALVAYIPGATPQQAFIAVFGSIEFGFGYVPGRGDAGLTVATGDATNKQNTIYILLGDRAFNDAEGDDPTDPDIGFPIHPAFVPVHELGHAFENRHGGSINTYGFVDATNSFWQPTTATVSESTLNSYTSNYPELRDEVSAGRIYLNTDSQGKPILNENEERTYIIPGGYYVPRGYGDADLRLFGNERTSWTPEEGYPDTFANFILNPNVLTGSPRGDYFDEHMQEWIDVILASGQD